MTLSGLGPGFQASRGFVSDRWTFLLILYGVEFWSSEREPAGIVVNSTYSRLELPKEPRKVHHVIPTGYSGLIIPSKGVCKYEFSANT